MACKQQVHAADGKKSFVYVISNQALKKTYVIISIL